MSNTTTMFGMIALFAVGMIFSSPLTASVAAQQQDDFLDIKKAIVKIDEDVITDIVYKTQGFIPQDGSGGSFGYGVVTAVPSEVPEEDPQLNVIATTSHPGLEDSITQGGDPDNPIIHNHYVILGDDPVCDDVDPSGNVINDNPSVQDLSFTQPGDVFVKGNKAIVKNLPPSQVGQFTNVVITPGSDIQVVASFLLEARENEEGEPVVCVTDIMPVEPQDERTVIFGKKDIHHDDDNKPDYGKQYGYEYPEEESYDKKYEYEGRY